jgi:hypothetical protein
MLANEGAGRDGKLRRSRLRGVMAGLLVLTGAVVLAWAGLAPTELPAPSDPTITDAVFQNRGMIFAVRLLVVFAALVLSVGGVFMISSIVVRMRNGDWLKRIGPFEVSETAASDVGAQLTYWRAAARARQLKLDELLAASGFADSALEDEES